MEKVTVETSMGPVKMRADDHQALIPLAVSVVSKDAKYKADGTPLGFKTIKLLTGEQASGAVSPACKMVPLLPRRARLLSARGEGAGVSSRHDT